MLIYMPSQLLAACSIAQWSLSVLLFCCNSIYMCVYYVLTIILFFRLFFSFVTFFTFVTFIPFIPSTSLSSLQHPFHPCNIPFTPATSLSSLQHPFHPFNIPFIPSTSLSFFICHVYFIAHFVPRYTVYTCLHSCTLIMCRSAIMLFVCICVL